MIVYLRSIPAQPDGALPPQSPPAGGNQLGARVFAEACAGCHLPSGGGRQSAWAALAGSQTASDPAGTNLVQVLVGGTQIQTGQGLMFMHAFTPGYTDPELAAVANYVIGQFGGRQGEVTADQIRIARGGTEPAAQIPEQMIYGAAGAAGLIVIACLGWMLTRRRRRIFSRT
jgi:mono/diheme cytochrome c family protein